MADRRSPLDRMIDEATGYDPAGEAARLAHERAVSASLDALDDYWRDRTDTNHARLLEAWGEVRTLEAARKKAAKKGGA